MLDRLLVGVGHAIGKPTGWERLVRALAPPSRFVGQAPRARTMPGGYVFPVDAGTLLGWSIHFFGTYEPEVRAVIGDRLGPGDTAIDVGANVGWHALLMASRVGPTGRVYAFEPNESTRQRLVSAVEANHFNQIVVDPRAAADHEGPTGFDAPAAGETWDGTGRLVSTGAERTVECVTLDRFAAERGVERVALIKIDVEGWELSVLRGATRVLRALRPVVVFEYDPAYVSRSGGTAADLTALLTNAGYSLLALRAGHAPRAVPELGATGGNFMAVPKGMA